MKSVVNDWRYVKVIGFLKAKGLLYADNIASYSQAKLWTEEIIWVAEQAEPRVWEVLPAALLNYPKAFMDSQQLPKEILELTQAIRNNTPVDVKYKWIDYQLARRWADIRCKDRRAKPAHERKKMKTFRLSPLALKNLRMHSKAMNTTETEILEKLLSENTTKFHS